MYVSEFCFLISVIMKENFKDSFTVSIFFRPYFLFFHLHRFYLFSDLIKFGRV